MKKRGLLIFVLIALLSMTVLVSCGEKEGHRHDYVIKSDADGHWEECSCGDKKNSGAHVDAVINATGESGADGLCDVCGYKMHVHDYTYKSDAESHWEECSCGDKKNSSAHVDELNNETGEDGADGLCDVCGHALFAVTFDMGGHGVTPDTQYVGDGGFVVRPETPDDDDAYKFAGWYKDAEGETEFDFATETVTENTTVYAKWDEDTTAGASKKYAYALTLGEANLQELKTGDTVYFKCNINSSGRYTVGLYGLNSRNATYTTNVTEGTYGKDCESNEVYFDLRSAQTVYILFTYLGADDNEQASSPIVTQVTDEPIPEGMFLSGLYKNDTYIFEFDRDEKLIMYNEKSMTAKFVGGSFNTLTFIQELNLGGTIYTNTFTMTYSDGNYTVKVNSGSASVILYTVPQEPIDYNKLEGIYEPQGAAVDSITKLYIYSTSESSKYIVYNQSGNWSTYERGSYSDNTLSFMQYSITLNLDDSGEIESINLSYSGGTGVYVRKGAAGEQPPKKLDIESSSQYFGYNGYVIRDNYGYSQYFGATGYNVIIVTGYDKTADTYTVTANKIFYKAVMKGNSIELYDEKGTELLDVLKLFEGYSYESMPTGDVTLEKTDFTKNLYLYTVDESGWYMFTNDSKAIIYYGFNEGSEERLTTALKATSGKKMFLTAGTRVAVSINPIERVTFKIEKVDAPYGMNENDPVIIEDGSAEFDGLQKDATAYFKFTAPNDGTFAFNVYYDNGSAANDAVSTVIINGREYTGNPYPAVELKANDEIIIAVTLSAENKTKLNVKLIDEYYPDSATTLQVTETVEETKKTYTASIEADGIYRVATIDGKDFVFSAENAFTVTLYGGMKYEANVSEDGSVYTVKLIGKGDIYFKVESQETQTVAFTQTLLAGIDYVHNVSFTDDNTVTLTIVGNATYEFTLPVGKYIIEATTDGNSDIDLYINGKQVWITDVTVSAEDEFTYKHTVYKSGAIITATITITKIPEIFDASVAGKYTATFTDSDDKEVEAYIIFDEYGIGEYKAYAGIDVVITNKADGTYTFEYETDWETGATAKVTFRFDDDGNIVLTDTDLTGTLTFVKQDDDNQGDVSSDNTYSGVSTMGRTITLTINSDFTSGTVTINGSSEDVTINFIEDDSWYQFYIWSTFTRYTFTVEDDGSLKMDIGFGSDTVILTK